MTDFEFREVLNVMDIYNPIREDQGRYGAYTPVHSWGDIELNFGGSYYTVVHGKIPLEVAKIIYKKYPDNQYQIRVDGGCEDWNPTKWASTDRNGNKYLRCYHIDTKEGLLIFLTEMQDYYLRKANKPETEVARYNELLAQVNAGMLEKANASMTIDEWMQGNKDYNIYKAGIERDKNDEFATKFREALEEFDKAVNPYLNEDIELAPIADYQQKVTLSAALYDKSLLSERDRDNSFRMVIKENTKNGNYTKFSRNGSGFLYECCCVIGKDQCFHVRHYFYMDHSEKILRGETIAFETYGENVKNKIDMRLNLTNGTIGETYGKKTDATPLELKYAYEKLLESIELAKKVTIKNMKKNSRTKKI